MLGGRTIGVVVMFFFVLFAVSSAWTFYGFPGLLYTQGPGYVMFIWGSVAGFAGLYMFLGPRLWALAKINRFLSPVELLAELIEHSANLPQTRPAFTPGRKRGRDQGNEGAREQGLPAPNAAPPRDRTGRACAPT